MFSFLKSKRSQEATKPSAAATQAPSSPIYTPLSAPSNIRLIHILPGENNDPIRLFMFETTSDEAYQALSYVWGDAKVTLPISLNDQPFQITTNLHSFLRRLRHPTDSTGSFWADAICINQRDNEEKSVQVGMMDKIYRGAERAIVWLGEEEEDTHLAFEVAAAIAEASRQVYGTIRSMAAQFINAPRSTSTNWATEIGHDMATIETINQAMHMTFLEGIAPDCVFVHNGAWEALYKLLRNPWFSRMWTVQEFMLPTNIDFLCGSKVLDVHTLTLCCAMISNATRRSTQLPHTQGKDVAWWTSVILGLRCFQMRSEGMDMHRTHLLDTAKVQRERQASDPRDKLFAVCSIARAPTFRIDYSKSVQEVYRAFAVWCIDQQKLSDILRATSQPQRIQGIPTWVPDWTVNNPYADVLTTATYKGAGGSEPAVVRLSADSSSLHVHAIVLDTITQDVPTAGIRKTVGYVSLLLKMPPLAKVNIIRPPNQSKEEALYRTFARDGGTSLNVGDVKLRIPAYVSMADAKALAGERVPHKLILTVPRAEVPFHDTVYIPHGSTIDLRILDIALGMNLFVTSRGYIGLARKDVVKKGDIVAVIKGVTMPVILRKKGNSYCLRDGYAYVHAVMDGEVMPDVAAGRLRWEEIELR